MIIYYIFYHDVCLSSWFWRYVQLTMQTALSKCWQQLFFGICLISSSILLVDGFILQKMGRGRVGKKFKQSGDKRHGSAVPRAQRASLRPHQRRRALPVQRSGGPFPDAFSMGMGHYAGMSLAGPRHPKALRDDTGEKSNFPGKNV